MKNKGKSLDILFVVPRNPPAAGIVSHAYGITPPLGVASMAACLRSKGLTAAILDNSLENLEIPEFKKLLAGLKPRCLGISLLTYAVDDARELAKAGKETDREMTVVAGGAHASALPYDVLRDANIDLVVKGEGEETILELITALKSDSGLDRVDGIIYRRAGEIVENPGRKPIEDLDRLPIPAYDLLKMDKYYLSASRRLASGGTGYIITSRGCPYNCKFCSRAVFGGKVRYRSAKAVLEEVLYLKLNYGIRELLICDDTFTADAPRAMEISGLLAKHAPGLVWSCNSRADHFSDKLYAQMRLGGCRQISFGMESGSQPILDDIRKGLTLEQINAAVAGCRRHKIACFCCFILGFPGDTETTVKTTIEFAKRLDPDFAAFCALNPLPGSEFFDEALRSGIINLDGIEWANFVNLMSAAPPPVRLGALTGPQLVNWQKKALREFYLRPGYILRTLGRIGSAENLLQLCRGAYTITKYQFTRMNDAGKRS